MQVCNSVSGGYDPGEHMVRFDCLSLLITVYSAADAAMMRSASGLLVALVGGCLAAGLL